jgi:hypothetical protein
MALPSLGFYTTGGVAITTHNFLNIEAGAYAPDSTGYKTLLYNDYGGTLGSENATSVKITARDVDGGTDEVWTQQRWIQVKSNGCSTGSIINDAQTVFKPVGLNTELALGDIPSNQYRTIYTRCYPPTDAAAQHVDFQLRATYQNPTSPISKWITGIHGNGIIPSTGKPFIMSTGGSTGGTIPYMGGYALIDDNEIYYGSSGSYIISATTGTGTYNIYLDGTGAFGETTGVVASNQLHLYEATFATGQCSALIDKRVYLSNLREQVITTTTGIVNINWNEGLSAIYTRSSDGEGNATFTFTDPVKSCDLTLLVKGNDVDTNASSGILFPKIYWYGSIPPTFSTDAGMLDKVELHYSTGLPGYAGFVLNTWTTV